MRPDPQQSASHRVLGPHLTGPLQPGAADEPLELDAAGRVVVPAGREPLVLVGPRAPLADAGLRVEAVLEGGHAPTVLPALEFAPWTEAGAFLVLLVPAVDPATRMAPAARLALRVRELRPDGTRPLVRAGETRARVEVTVLHGTLGRVLHVLAAEKARLRRTAREVLAGRRLGFARDDALDRHGADLAVARFSETLAFARGAIVTPTRREPDAEYARRLRLYRPWMTPTRRGLADTLAELDRRFAVVEEDDELAIAIRVVGAGLGAQRDNLLTYVRDARLVRPLPDGDQAHRRRLLPSRERARIEALRGLLREHLAFTGQAATDPALSEGLAEALVLAARCREALGLAGPWALRRAQDGAGGSRYELGLGTDAEPPKPAEVRRLFKAARDPRRPPAADPDVEGVLAGTEPVAPRADRDGAWLLHACGLRTVHRTARN